MHLRVPARRDERGGVELEQDRRSDEAGAGGKGGPVIERRVDGAAGEMDGQRPRW